MTAKSKKKNRYQQYLERDFAQFLGEFKAFKLGEAKVDSLESLALAIAETGQDVYFKAMKNGRIYKWLKETVADDKLARQIRHIAEKNNAVELVRERIAELHEFVRHPQNSFMYHKLELYTEKTELVCDHDKCVQCDICELVCPQEALSFGENEEEEAPRYLEISDKCSLCSLCAAFCPTGALKFYYNGEEHEFFHSLGRMPQLPPFKDVNGKEVRAYFEGTIKIKEECSEKCECGAANGECSEHCIPYCPTGALRKYDDKGITKKTTIDDEYCIYCGACKQHCTEDNIELTRMRVISEGDQFSTAWADALEKLLGTEHVNLYHSRKSRKKLHDLALKSGEVKYEGFI